MLTVSFHGVIGLTLKIQKPFHGRLTDHAVHLNFRYLLKVRVMITSYCYNHYMDFTTISIYGKEEHRYSQCEQNGDKGPEKLIISILAL